MAEAVAQVVEQSGAVGRIGRGQLHRCPNADAAIWPAHLSLAVTLVPLLSRLTPPPPDYQPPADRLSPFVGITGALILVVFFLTPGDLLGWLVAFYGVLLIPLAGIYVLGSTLFPKQT